MFRLIILSAAVSGIPSSTWPLPGTTKNTQCFLTFLNLISTAHVPNCIIFVLLYVQSLIWLFVDFLSCSSIVFLNNYSGMMLPSLPVSILYGIFTMSSPACISKYAVINDQFLFKWIELILTVSIWPSCISCSTLTSSSCTTWSLLLLHTFLKWSVFPHLVHILPYAGHHHGMWTPLQYLHGCQCPVAPVICLIWLSFDFWATLILLNWHYSIMSFSTAACAHCASTLLTHANTPFLVVCSLLFFCSKFSYHLI